MGNLYDLTADEINTIAKTAHGEARGEITFGIMGVISVILNRYQANRHYFGTDLIDVCLKNDTKGNYQFSCWNPWDVNFSLIENLHPNILRDYYQIIDICIEQWGRLIPSNVFWYHSNKIKAPKFFEKLRRYAIIGNHIFYRELK